MRVAWEKLVILPPRFEPFETEFLGPSEFYQLQSCAKPTWILANHMVKGVTGKGMMSIGGLWVGVWIGPLIWLPLKPS